MILHYFKRFTKYPPLHFQNMQKPHKRLLNHTRITPGQQKASCRPGKPPGTHTKLEKDQTSVVAHSILPQTTFSKLQTKPSTLRIDPRSIFNSYSLNDHERESFHNNFILKNDENYSLSKITTLIVKLLRNSSGLFLNQSVNFTWLKWNQLIKKINQVMEFVVV